MILFVRSGRFETVPAAWLPLRVKPGENNVTIAIPPLHTLKVRQNARAAGTVWLQREDAPERFQRATRIHRRPGADGSVETGPLPAGRYRVTCSTPSGREEQIVSIPGTRVVTFD